MDGCLWLVLPTQKDSLEGDWCALRLPALQSQSPTLSSSVVGGSDALKPLLTSRVPTGRKESRTQRIGCAEWGDKASWKGWKRHSQLETEGDTQDFKSFHLKIHSDGSLVILIEGVFAEPKGTGGSL